MADIDLLTDEIRRVLTAPYAVWLKKLKDIVNKVDKPTLQQWADGHPCQINALAKAVIDGLQLWPGIIEILQNLCYVAAFRNAVLAIRPSLLDTLLTKAVESQHGYDQYYSACVSMLSAPLPEDYALPASAGLFFVKVMEAAVASPSAMTIRPIYSLFVGVGPELLDILPEAESMQFQERLIRLLRNVDDQTANLLCLAIFAKLVTPSVCGSSHVEMSSQGPTPISATSQMEQTSRFLKIAQFFGQKRAAKTLDLVVLRVIFACSNSSNLSREDAQESLKLAKEIMGSIDVEEKDHWLKSNGPKVQKLYEKVLRVDLPRGLQSMAFEAISSLVKVESLSAQLSKTFQCLILGVEPSVAPDIAERPLSRGAIEYLAPRMEESFISEVMRSTLKAAVQPATPVYKAMRMCRTAGLMVSAFAAAVHHSQQLRSAILFTLSANTFSRPINDMLTLPLPTARDAETCAEHGVCPAALARSQRRLRLDICSLFLRTGLLASTDQAGIDPALAVALLEKQVEFALPIPACRFASHPVQRTGALSLVEQTSTPSEHRASSDWRDRLAADLLRNANSNSESMIRTVGEVCRDLEDRCKIVERPLKEEQARSKDLEIKLESASTRIAELESQADERNLFLNGLEVEKSSLEGQVRACEARAADLADNFQEMELNYIGSKAEAEKAAAAAREEASDQNLKHLAIIGTKEDIISEQNERIVHSKQALQRIREELTAASQVNLEAEKRVSELEAEVIEVARATELERVSSARKDIEIGSLQRVEVELRADFEAAESVTREQAVKMNCLQNELQSLRLSSEEDLEKLKQSYESDKLSAAKEVERLTQSHQEEIATLNNELQKAVHTASLECSEKDSTISGLSSKVEKLLKDRKEKAREFAEAQDLSTKLMAVMGLKTDQAPALTHNPPKPSIKDIFADNSAGQHGSRSQTTTASSHSVESSTSSKSGPTPKRTRPRRSTRTPNTQQTKITLGAKTVKTAHDTISQSTRQPLKELGAAVHNRSPVKTQRHGSGKLQPGQDHVWVDERGEVDQAMDYGDLSFGGSDVFASTEKELSSARDVHRHSQLYDESTADF